jgi:hypothetical protein
MRRPVLLAVLVSIMVALSAATAFAMVMRPNFRAPQFYQAGPGPDGIVTGDFNEDGKSDLVTSNRYGGSDPGTGDVSCLQGAGDGTFTEVSEEEFTNSTNSISMGKLNKGNHLDVVVTDPDAPTPNARVVVLLGDGDCTFTEKDSKASGGSSPGYDPFDTALGDFDEDGDTDVAVTNQESNTVRIFANNGRGNLSNDQTIQTGAGSNPNGIAAGSIDADRDKDLAVALSGSGEVAVLKNDGSGTFTLNPTTRDITNAEAPYPSPLVLADFNKDGKLDVATGNVDGDEADDDVVAVALGNDDGTFGEPVFKSSGGDCPLSLQTGDYGRDGMLDISAANQYCSVTDSSVNRGNFGVLSGRGDGTFAGPDRFDAGDGPLGITDGRYNADNKLDIATATFGASGPASETDTVAISINKTPN